MVSSGSRLCFVLIEPKRKENLTTNSIDSLQWKLGLQSQMSAIWHEKRLRKPYFFIFLYDQQAFSYNSTLIRQKLIHFSRGYWFFYFIISSWYLLSIIIFLILLIKKQHLLTWNYVSSHKQHLTIIKRWNINNFINQQYKLILIPWTESILYMFDSFCKR